jgi:two-component sensor histidine kinase/CHASE1-domain containing sensor protein
LKRAHGTSIPSAAVVALVGTVASLAAGLVTAHRWERAQLEARAAENSQFADAVEQRFVRVPRTALLAAGFMMASDDGISHLEFERYATALFDTTGGSVTAMAWLPRTRPSEVPVLEAEMRRQGLVDFRVRAPDGAEIDLASHGRDLYPVVLRAPDEPSQTTFGIDVAMSPARWQAIRRAIETGAPVASEPVRTFAQNVTAVFLYHAVYWRDTTPTMPARPDEVAGIVALRLDAGVFFAQVAASWPTRAFGARLLDPAGGSAGGLIAVADLMAPASPPAGDGPMAVIPMQFAGRTWNLEFSRPPLPAGWPASAYAALVIGLLATTLLSSGLWAAAQRMAATARHLAELEAEVAARRRTEAARELLVAELSHRVKNTLAVIQGMMLKTLSRSRSLEEFGATFQGRLRALAGVHGLLLQSTWTAVDLPDLARQELGMFGDAVRLEGGSIPLSPKQGLSLGLVLHELATNALRHGALASDAGLVTVAWQLDGDGRTVRLRWHESGASAPQALPAGGFGTQLIRRAVAYELDGSAECRVHAGGLEWCLAFPATPVDDIGKRAA